MDRTPSTTLIDDAEAILGSIRRAVLLDLQEPGKQNVFGDLIAEIEALRAQIDNSPEIDGKLDLLRTLARAASETGKERTKFQILDVLSSIESILVGVDLEESQFSDELLEIVEASFDSFPTPQRSEVIETGPILQLEEPDEGETLDPELLEIFAEESEQLLSAFSEQLRVSKSDPTNKEIVWELRRIAHTFKGAAGVVGLSAAAELAHRIENTLDRLAASPERHIAHLLPLLEPAVDLLRDLAQDGKRTDLRIEAVKQELDALLGDYPVGVEGKQVPAKKGPTQPGASDPPKVSKEKKSVVRVSLAVLDLIDHRVREFTKTLSNLRECLDPTRAKPGNEGSFRELFELQFFLANSIMEELRSLRMIEFNTLTPRLLRAVRVACEEEEKRAEILIENSEMKLDTLLLDSLVEPLMHLLRNSVVHGIESAETRRLLGKPENGMIRLQLNESPGHIEIALTDDGRGIDTSALKAKAVELGTLTQEESFAMPVEDAYELVYQTGLSTADKLTLQAGRGVGMRIVRDSIHELGGTISIISARNVGTTFSIKLPRIKHDSDGQVVQNPLILSVDDSLSVRKANRKIIEDLGFTSLLANGGSEAMKLLNDAERLPDLIITDLEMPGMDGFQFIAALKKSDRLSQIPVVVLSTKTDQINRDMAFQLGAVECFQKPLDRQELRMITNVFIKG
jgi:CheY-like chemotaxis protein